MEKNSMFKKKTKITYQLYGCKSRHVAAIQSNKMAAIVVDQSSYSYLIHYGSY
jgi:hypothetical protein